MGVFRNENAAALLFRDTQQQEKCSKKDINSWSRNAMANKV